MQQKTILFLVILLSTMQVEAKKLNALFSYCTFFSPVQGPYLETYLSINSASVYYKLTESNLYQAKVEVILTLRRGDKIIYYDKYNLLSPEANDTTNVKNFIDQQRVRIPDGVYNLTLTMTDRNNADQSYEVTESIDVHFPDSKISVSDIELIDTYKASAEENGFSKNGYELIPFIGNFYGASDKTLTFYIEFYNTDKILADNPWLAYYYVTEYNKREIVSDLTGFSRQQPVPLKGYLAQIPMGSLASGNYELNVEVKSKTNEVLAAKKIFFQRSSGKTADEYNIPVESISTTFVSVYTNGDSLKEYLNYLYPKANTAERQYISNQVGLAEVNQMQYFFYRFWKKRNPLDPEKEWLNYLEEVKKVNSNYSTRIQKGYKTDRGRVYLQYGPPNTINEHPNEPNAYPYELWHYYKLDNQSNKKFVFYNKNTSTNDYELLHSDAQGEVYEPRWEMILHERLNQSGLDWDVEKVPSHLGGHSDSDFSNPK